MYVNIHTPSSIYKYGPISDLVGFVVTLSERGMHAQYRTVGHLFSMFSIGIGKVNFPHRLS